MHINGREEVSSIHLPSSCHYVTYGFVCILNSFSTGIALHFCALSLQFVCCQPENQIRISPQQWELTKDTYDPHTPGSWNQKTKTRNCNCCEQQRSILSLVMCQHLYWPAVSKPCVSRWQKPTWERSSVQKYVFGLFCLKRFMPGAEILTEGLQKLMLICLDQTL